MIDLAFKNENMRYSKNQYKQELRRASKDCSGRKYTNDYILYQIVTVGPLGPL